MANASTQTRLPVLNGGISGGEAYVFSDPLDVVALLGLTNQVTDVLQLSEALQVAEIRAQFPSYRDQWLGVRDDTLAQLRSKQIQRPDDFDDRDELLLALLTIDAVWSAESPESSGEDGLQLLVCIAEVGGELEVEGDKPALFLHHGSIGSTLTNAEQYVVRGTSWILSLVPGSPRSSAAIASRLVEDIRDRARGRLPKDESHLLDLRRLDDVKPAELNQLRLVIVAVHGLLGTDIGTFDEFLRKLHLQTSGRWEELTMLGWPHDTLTSIENNGNQLADLIHERIGVSGPDIGFICHSRGGLVAREAALRLYETAANYRRALRGAITFGTPHEGTDLAAHSEGDFLSYLVCVLAGAASGKIATLRQITAYRRTQVGGVIHGIQDLRPPDAAGFISSLKNRERSDQGKPDGAIRQLDVITAGGDYQEMGSVGFMFASRYFGRDIHHDLVVPTGSSTPTGTLGRYIMPCTHSDYCSVDMRAASGLATMVQHAIRWLP